MAELFKVNAPVRKPLFEGVQGENEARSIQFDITPWVEELGDGAVTATAKRSQDSQPYPVTVTKDGTTVTWKPTSTDTAYAGVGSFQLEYTVDSVLAKTCIWSTMVAPSLDPAGDPPDPYDNWLAEMRQVAANALQSEQNAEDSAEDAEAWAVGQRGGVDVTSTDPTYENNSKYWAEQSLANQYGAYIVKSASGDIASFADGADNVPMKSLKVAIVPKQSGSGDPSPTNVRPISGTSTANVTVVGKNLFDISQITSGSTGGINYSVSGNTLTYSGTASTSGWKTAFSFQLPQTGVYHFHMDTTGDGGNFLEGFSANGTDITINCTSTDTWYRIAMVAVSAGTAVSGTISNIQIELGSSATAFEPYNGHTTPVPLGQTVYGGEVNPISGELVIDRAYAAMNGTENWSLLDGVFVGVILGIKQASTTSAENVIIADRFKPNGVKYRSECGDGNIIKVVGSNNYVACYSSNYASVDAFKSALASNPMQVVYELATPTTVQLTPTQVATLLGTNNVWSDAGSVEVEYRADPTLAYNELANVIVSLGGNL